MKVNLIAYLCKRQWQNLSIYSITVRPCDKKSGYISLYRILVGSSTHLSIFMQLLNTYTEKEEAEQALKLITGTKRLASERDSTEIIYNLFGQPTWSNFYKLKMFKLPLLQDILQQRKNGQDYDSQQHHEIISMLKYTAKRFKLEIPTHWL